MTYADADVFVVDDDISVRESLELLIQSAGWQPVVCASAQAFLEHPRTDRPGCLILDIGLPDLNGLVLQRRVADIRSDLPIIMLTGLGDIPTTVQAMKAGAVEFLTKPFNADVLLHSIAQAIERSRIAMRDQGNLRQLRDRYAALSPREREVMVLVTAGLLNKQVGSELGITEITVKAHRGRVMRKMKADSLADLVHMVSALGLTPPLSDAGGEKPRVRRHRASL